MSSMTKDVFANLSDDLREKLEQSQSVLRQAFDNYEPSHIFLSFNGGKDCTVLLHILSEMDVKGVKVIYFRSEEPFQEIEDFVVSCEDFYQIKISRLTTDRTMKEMLTRICKEDTDIEACIMGSRRTDPYCENLKSFDPTDRGWPKLMRINPMLDWNCANVWEYLLTKKVPYCSLYDRGYTSIGNRSNTLPNPHLEETPGSFLPAYKLLDDSLERAGRIVVKK